MTATTRDSHRVGFVVTMRADVFRQLVAMSATPDVPGWSAVIVRLVREASK